MEDFVRLLPWTDLLFVNQDECGMLAGTREPAAAAQFFAGHGTEIVVVKTGGTGCRVFHRGASFESPAYQVDAVDTTGAGDCFVGGFLSALVEGSPLEDCARLANAVAAMSVRSMGAVTGLRGAAETAGFMAATPLRQSLEAGS
jgi:sugar/nucleoside kinase (ribokinase family)